MTQSIPLKWTFVPELERSVKMEDKIIHERYRELACEVIRFAINEWLANEDRTEYALYKWIQECEWFDFLGLDREYFFCKVRKLREKGIKSIGGGNYGKKEKL